MAEPAPIVLTPEKKRLFAVIMVVGLALFLLAGLGIAELVARSIEKPMTATYVDTPDPRLGWTPKPGNYHITTGEFDTTVTINSLHMNDREWTPADVKKPVRILAVGDSHTFATGASVQETWPKRTESILFGPDHENGVVMNAGVVGYSVGQYLERYRALRDTIQPNVLVIGFSTATDLYDLITPERGGFIYGGDAERVFFDIDDKGGLWERTYKKPTADASAKSAGVSEQAPPAPAKSSSPSQALRDALQSHSALYRRLKRSKLAMTVATFYRPGGQSLWPGVDTAMKKTLNDDDLYRWKLAELVIAKMADEAHERGTKVALVQIPYLPQVYDEVWNSSFGLKPNEYDRQIAAKRLAELCARHGITFIDSTPALVDAVHQRKHWVHWPEDGHPTPEGQEIIGEVVAAGLRSSGLVPAASSPP